MLSSPAGIVQFKYFSQNTIDRPGIDHLVKVVDWARALALPPAKTR